MDYWSYEPKPIGEFERKDEKLYVNRLYVVEPSRFFRGNEPRYAKMIAWTEFWGFPTFKNLVDAQKDTGCVIYDHTGNVKIEVDRYGDKLKEITLEQAMDFMNKADWGYCLDKDKGSHESLELSYSIIETIWKKDCRGEYRILYYKF